MTDKMIYKENPLSGDWLCWIPETPIAYYYPTKKKAKEFSDVINKALEDGKLTIEYGRLKKVPQ